MKVGNKLKTKNSKRIVKGKEKRNEKKIKIETESDLCKLPLNTINNSKIYMFYGKYYDKIYNKAIQIEKSNNKIVPDIILSKKVKKIIKIKKKVLKKRNSKNGTNKIIGNDSIDIKNNSCLTTRNKAHYKFPLPVLLYCQRGYIECTPLYESSINHEL